MSVANHCPIPLWIHAAGQQATLMPDARELQPGQFQEYAAPRQWNAARITAYPQGPDGGGNLVNEIDKVEMTFDATGATATLNTNITYVDWVGLPSRIEAIGSGGDCTTVGCDVPLSQLLVGCPDGLNDGQKCLSASNYCSRAENKDKSYCHALDGKISQCAQQLPECAGASGATTWDAYACAGFFSNQPKLCAALNRGVLDHPDGSTPSTDFYVNPPFNTYSQWVHQRCPGIYAFAYDDFGVDNQSGYHACTGGTRLNVTFCPAD